MIDFLPFLASKTLAIDEVAFDSSGNIELDFLSRKFDISKKLYQKYDDKGDKIGTEPLSQEGYKLFAALLYKRLLLAFEKGAANDIIAKYLNVFLKANDSTSVDFFLSSSLQDMVRQELIGKFIALLPNDTNSLQADNYIAPSASADNTFTELPLDILFYEGPIARAYLETLHHLELRPKRIIHLISENNLVTGKKVGIFLPSGLRPLYASATQARQIHYWPHKLFKMYRDLCLNIFTILEETLGFDQPHFENQINLKSLNAYSGTVFKLPISSLKDERLFKFLKSQNSKHYLFTGGGIVPAQFFDLKDNHFLHIHPGYLPDIRGADCLLWSILLTGQPSGTCFYLNSGIDTGDIIHASWLPKIILPPSLARFDGKTLYRLLYAFVDPWVRSYIFREILTRTDLLTDIHTSPQSNASGTTFHFMHDDLRKVAYNKIVGN